MSTKNDGGGSNLPTVRRGVRAHEVMTFESSALIRKVRDVSLAECPGIKAKLDSDHPRLDMVDMFNLLLSTKESWPYDTPVTLRHASPISLDTSVFFVQDPATIAGTSVARRQQSHKNGSKRQDDKNFPVSFQAFSNGKVWWHPSLKLDNCRVGLCNRQMSTKTRKSSSSSAVKQQPPPKQSDLAPSSSSSSFASESPAQPVTAPPPPSSLSSSTSSSSPSLNQLNAAATATTTTTSTLDDGEKTTPSCPPAPRQSDEDEEEENDDDIISVISATDAPDSGSDGENVDDEEEDGQDTSGAAKSSGGTDHGFAGLYSSIIIEIISEQIPEAKARGGGAARGPTAANPNFRNRPLFRQVPGLRGIVQYWPREENRSAKSKKSDHDDSGTGAAVLKRGGSAVNDATISNKKIALPASQTPLPRVDGWPCISHNTFLPNRGIPMPGMMSGVPMAGYLPPFPPFPPSLFHFLSPHMMMPPMSGFPPQHPTMAMAPLFAQDGVPGTGPIPPLSVPFDFSRMVMQPPFYFAQGGMNSTLANRVGPDGGGFLRCYKCFGMFSVGAGAPLVVCPVCHTVNPVLPFAPLAARDTNPPGTVQQAAPPTSGAEGQAAAAQAEGGGPQVALEQTQLEETREIAQTIALMKGD